MKKQSTAGQVKKAIGRLERVGAPIRVLTQDEQLALAHAKDVLVHCKEDSVPVFLTEDLEFLVPFIDEEEDRSFEDLVKPLIKLLNDRGNPHSYILIDVTSAQILDSELSYNTEIYIKD